MLRLLAAFCTLALCVGIAGCGHYRLGTDSKPSFSTLHVNVVKNETLLPQAVAIVTNHVREAFLKDGRVKLVNAAEEADATLTLTLEDYRREVAVVRPDDTGLARRYDLVLRVRGELRDNRTQKTFFAGRPFEVRRGAFTDGGQLQAEYQALPLLAEKLAQDAVRSTLETW